MRNKRTWKLSETVKRLRKSKMKYNSGMKRLTEPSYEWDFETKNTERKA